MSARHLPEEKISIGDGSPAASLVESINKSLALLDFILDTFGHEISDEESSIDASKRFLKRSRISQVTLDDLDAIFLGELLRFGAGWVASKREDGRWSGRRGARAEEGCEDCAALFACCATDEDLAQAACGGFEGRHGE